MFDPFDVFGIKKQFPLDLNMLEKHYFEAQKKVHPDRFAPVEGDTKAEALRQSMALNQAYALLKDPLERAAFLLKERGVELITHDPLFLSEVMVWNERLEAGADLSTELRLEEERLFKNLENAFETQNYEHASMILYQLTYVRKMVKNNILDCFVETSFSSQ